MKTLSKVAAFGLLAVACGASQAQAGVVISQVYGGGGNSTAQYTNDFIELFNNGTTAQSLNGWSVQYISAGGTAPNTAFGGITALPNLSIAAGSYFLVGEASGGTNGVVLPATDATGTANLSASNGKVALVSNTTAVALTAGSSAVPTGAGIIDFVGYGTASQYEGAAAAPGLSNTTAAIRKTTSTGYQDTDVNSTDFVTGAPTPHNSSSVFAPPASAVITASINSPYTANNDILLGATVASDYSGTLSVNNSGTLAGSYTVGSSGLTLTPSTGNPSLAASASDTINYALPTAPTAYGTINTTITVTPGSGSGSPSTTTIRYFVGNLFADNTNSTSSFGGFTDIAHVAAGGPLVGLSSNVSGSAAGAGSGALLSEAKILAGTNTSANPIVVGETWRTRTQTELTNGVVVSDVVRLSGISIGTQYVLQISYDNSVTSTYEAIGQFIGGHWDIAAYDNYTGTAHYVGAVAWAGDTTLGDYGFDPINHVAWAVLDHSGTFAVVPEPASLGLLAIGACGLLARRRRA